MSFAKYCVIYKEFTPTITLNGRNLSRTYMTSLRSFPHFWDPQIKSQPYIQDFLEKLSSFFWDPQIESQPYIQDFLEKLFSSLGSNYKSNPNRTYKTFLRRFHHL